MDGIEEHMNTDLPYDGEQHLSGPGCLEAGYENYQQIRADPDLANLRADERFEVRSGGTGACGIVQLVSGTQSSECCWFAYCRVCCNVLSRRSVRASLEAFSEVSKLKGRLT